VAIWIQAPAKIQADGEQVTLATILVWMAMQGQDCRPMVGQLVTPCTSSAQGYVTDNGHMTAESLAPSDWKPLFSCAYFSDGTKECSGVNLVPPREHVIEIRTKRTGQVEDWWAAPQDTYFRMRARADCIGRPDLYVWDESKGCGHLRLTREVWIDGVRWGVLKETEGTR